MRKDTTGGKAAALREESDKWRGSAESVAYKPGKRAFLALLGLSAIGIILVGFVFWYIPTVGLASIHPLLPVITGAILALAGVFVIVGTAFLFFTVMNRRVVFYSPWFRWLLIRFFYPLMLMAGGLLKIKKIKIEQTFIEINNQMVRMMGRKFRPEKLLILMPHCIQFDNCRIKVTRNVKNCAGCGKCEIGNLLTLSEEFNVSLFISTGGTVARRKLTEDRPDAVVAVACERDLTSGVQDAYPLPVMAIVNKRPRGYCMETGVELSLVRHAIKELIGQA